MRLPYCARARLFFDIDLSEGLYMNCCAHVVYNKDVLCSEESAGLRGMRTKINIALWEAVLI